MLISATLPLCCVQSFLHTRASSAQFAASARMDARSHISQHISLVVVRLTHRSLVLYLSHSLLLTYHSALFLAPIPPSSTSPRWLTLRTLLLCVRRSPPSLHHCTCCLRQVPTGEGTAPGGSGQPRSAAALHSLCDTGPSSVRMPSTSASAQRRESVKPVPASPLPTTSGACCNLHGRSSPPSRPRRRAPAPCPLAQVALEPAQLRLRTASVEAPRYSRQPHGAGLVPTQPHGISPARRKRPHPRRQRTSLSLHQSPAAS